MSNPMRKTKVLFIITKSNWGGAQRYVYELVTGLPADKFEAVVALGGNGPLTRKLRDSGIRVIQLLDLDRDINFFRDINSFRDLLHIIRAESPDIVHLNSSKIGGIGALAGRIAKVPKIVFTAHGWAFNEERPLWQKFIIKFFSWVTILLTHKTIAVSDAVKNNIAGWPKVSKKISVIKNGIREPKFFTRDEARLHILAKANIHIPENAFLVGTIAELHKNKGLSYAIEAFVKLIPKNPNLYYFILGGGEEKERLNALVGLHKLQGRVFLLGFVDDASQYLKAFDLFLLPSITEGLALVLLEAGFAGLPVIASRVGGIPEVISDNETGVLVLPRNPDAIVLGVQNIITDHSLAKRFGKTLRERVLTNFSLPRVLSSTISLYTNG